jgi:hypothetical protein
METYHLNVRGFVYTLGGPTNCWRRLRQMGVEITRASVSQWLVRDSMPSYCLVNLLAHEALNGSPIDLNKFIVAEQGAQPTRPAEVRSSLAPWLDRSPC